MKRIEIEGVNSKIKSNYLVRGGYEEVLLSPKFSLEGDELVLSDLLGIYRVYPQASSLNISYSDIGILVTDSQRMVYDHYSILPYLDKRLHKVAECDVINSLINHLDRKIVKKYLDISKINLSEILEKISCCYLTPSDENMVVVSGNYSLEFKVSILSLNDLVRSGNFEYNITYRVPELSKRYYKANSFEDMFDAIYRRIYK